MMLARQYFAKARRCEEMARTATKPQERAALLKAARAWQTLGEEREAEVIKAQSAAHAVSSKAKAVSSKAK